VRNALSAATSQASIGEAVSEGFIVTENSGPGFPGGGGVPLL
jgi:hypothetical protein